MELAGEVKGVYGARMTGGGFGVAQLDALRSLRQGVRRELLTESKRHKAWKRLCQIPSIGPIRALWLW